MMSVDVAAAIAAISTYHLDYVYVLGWSRGNEG